MKIVIAEPPMFDEIDAAFNVRGRPILFTWGDTIFNPHNATVSQSLKAHEGVHFLRQSNDTPAIEAWWRSYIADPEFRLTEEIPAHRAEYRQLCELIRDRNLRSKYLHSVAQRLAAPLYGSLVSVSKAKQLVSA